MGWILAGAIGSIVGMIATVAYMAYIFKRDSNW